MTQSFTYEITLKVQRESLLTVPIAGFHVAGRLDTGKDFAAQLEKTHARYLARIHPKLEEARRG